MQTPSFEQLLEAGVHFGHLKRKWNPKMAPYIFMERNGIHILDLHKTAAKLEEAANAMKQIAKSGRKVLFVATKKQAKEIVAESVSEIGMPFITERWSGGMLTNFRTIKKAIKKMNNFERMEKDGTFEKISKRERLQISRERSKLEKNLGSISEMKREKISKRERLQISRERSKLEKNLGSISEMKRLPAAIFVVDVSKEKIAVAEAKKLQIPVFGMVDTNSSPDIDFVIPANDDAAKSIQIVMNTLVEALKEGIAERKIEKPDEVDEDFEPEVKTRARNK